jgi:hypothetical protein
MDFGFSQEIVGEIEPLPSAEAGRCQAPAGFRIGSSTYCQAWLDI